MSFTGTCFGDFLSFIATISILFVLYVKWRLNYWKNKNVLHILPNFNATTKKFYNEVDYIRFKSQGHKFYGVYTFLRPTLIICDPELIKNIMVRDFASFNNRGFFYNPKDDPLSNHLFNNAGAVWRKMRTKMTPVFTSGKMKIMFNIVLECSNQLNKQIGKLALNDDTPIDIKEQLACFTTDVIGSCAFGLDFNSMNNTDAEFRKYGKLIFKQTIYSKIKRVFLQFYPSLGHLLRMTQIDKDVTKFFLNAVKKTVDYRESNNYRRNDFIQILIDLKNSETDDKPLTIEEIAAQSFLFFIAGFETSSSVANFALYELSRNKDVQTKLRKEINNVLKNYNGQLTYEAIKNMEYLTKVVDETMRKYPAGHSFIRQCTEDYTIPDTDVVIEKGTSIVIPLLAIHRDPEYYPDPKKFDPERFNDANKAKRRPFVYLPFGEGPRVCIGLRFGLMQSKIGLITLIKDYDFSVSEKTKPVVLDPQSFVTTSIDPIYLTVQKI